MVDIKHKLAIANNRINLKLHDILLPDYAHIRHIPQQLDIISLGSRPAKFAIDFSTAEANGFNLAVIPQTLEYDFRMLRNYHSYLGDNGAGLVILVLCPFSLLKRRYTEADGPMCADDRYYMVLHHALVNNYSETKYQKIKRHPLLYALSIAPQLKGLLSRRLQRQLAAGGNTQTADSIGQSARNYVQRWQAEFGIENLNSPLDNKLCDDIVFNVNIIANIKQFCAERGLRTVIIIPPMADSLAALLPDSFLRQALYSPIANSGVDCIDFSRHNEMSHVQNYFDALCLNADGRKKFTKLMLDNLKQKGLLQ